MNNTGLISTGGFSYSVSWKKNISFRGRNVQLCKALVIYFFSLSQSDVNRVDFASENLRRGQRQGLKDKRNVSRDLGQRG